MRKSKRKEKHKHRMEKRQSSNQENDRQIHKNGTFPFVDIDETVKYIKKSRVLFIMRGLPGSGKSTIVQTIKHKYKRAVVCSADTYFVNENGNYGFDSSKLQLAHQQCKDKAHKACSDGVSVVIVDNTNVKMWEMRPYIAAAAEFCYTVVTVEPQTWWKLIPDELARRNKHNVDVITMEKKVKQFQKIIPLYYGWFLSHKDSSCLIKLGRKYANTCFLFDDPHNSYLKVEDFDTHYNRYSDVLHCTALYAGRSNQDPKVTEYMERTEVTKSMGKMFNLAIIAFTVTPRTVGARVKLTRKQLLLWGKPDEQVGLPHDCDHDHGGNTHTSDIDFSKDIGGNDVCVKTEHMPYKNAPVSVEPCEKTGDLVHRMDKCDISCPNHDYADMSVGNNRAAAVPGICTVQYQTYGYGSTAHITLGCSAGNRPVQTGIDLAYIIDYDMCSRSATSYEIESGEQVKNYGDGNYAIYLNEPIFVKALFSCMH